MMTGPTAIALACVGTLMLLGSAGAQTTDDARDGVCPPWRVLTGFACGGFRRPAGAGRLGRSTTMGSAPRASMGGS